MIRIQSRIEELRLSTKMIMQVHDELVFEVLEEETQKALPMIQKEMEGVMELSVRSGSPSNQVRIGRKSLIESVRRTSSEFGVND
jgi:Ni,Fe-hydrogenase III large subunit